MLHDEVVAEHPAPTLDERISARGRYGAPWAAGLVEEYQRRVARHLMMPAEMLNYPRAGTDRADARQAAKPQNFGGLMRGRVKLTLVRAPRRHDVKRWRRAFLPALEVAGDAVEERRTGMALRILCDWVTLRDAESIAYDRRWPAGLVTYDPSRVRLTIAGTDVALIDGGALTAEDVRQMRFGGPWRDNPPEWFGHLDMGVPVYNVPPKHASSTNLALALGNAVHAQVAGILRAEPGSIAYTDGIDSGEQDTPEA